MMLAILIADVFSKITRIAKTKTTTVNTRWESQGTKFQTLSQKRTSRVFLHFHLFYLGLVDFFSMVNANINHFGLSASLQFS